MIGIGPGNGPMSTAAGPRRRCLSFIVWAQDGSIFLEDQRDGEIHVLSVTSARHRRDCFADEGDIWDKRREGSGDRQKTGYAKEMFRQMKEMVQVLDETIREAVAQGDYDNPEVREKKLVAFRRSRCMFSPAEAARGGRASDAHAQPSAMVFPTGYGAPIVFGNFGSGFRLPAAKTGGRPVAVDPGAIPLFPRQVEGS
jgi:hypothetical protein